MTQKSHVYAIRHIATGAAYVGCSTNKSQRIIRHKYLLRHRRHHAVRLQTLWERDGENSFEFVVIEELISSTKQYRKLREIHWIAQIGSLNTHISSPLADAFTLREEDAESRRQQALSRMEESPELRDFLSIRGQALSALAKTDDAREAMTEHSKRRWADPSEASRLRAGLEARWTDPMQREEAALRILNSSSEARKKKAMALSETWADPEKNKLLLESRKKRWSDPEAKARQAEKMRLSWEKRKAAKAT